MRTDIVEGTKKKKHFRVGSHNIPVIPIFSSEKFAP